MKITPLNRLTIFRLKKIIFIPLLLFFLFPKSILAITPTPSNNNINPTPIVWGCPPELNEYYQKQGTGERCVTNYETWSQDPVSNHIWVVDPKITAQGKADERAREFLYWVFTHPSIDDHPVILNIWNFSRNLAYFFVVFIASIMGIGIIIGRKNIGILGSSNFKIDISPLIIKLILVLLFITFSASIILMLIQISEILMKFFIENLGGKDLFNIYFSKVSDEKNYMNFIGQRDLNLRVQEAANTELFLLKLTNLTYYVMGVMLILRKIILWFLLFVSPFLALLMPFVFIRNVGWIWIGVFFQWVFYGPLFALFLGSLSKIWTTGIPFVFDFSRVDKPEGYIYPTAISILYGGPAQKLTAFNNGNYIDTFMEYVISLIMLWAVILFPWWLLRIFRDYCCGGIVAMKNILLSMYDQQHGGQPPRTPTPSLSPTQQTYGTARTIPREVEIPVKVRLLTTEEIKKAKTEEITKSLQLSVSNLTDVARFETNKKLQKTVTKNIEYLKTPTKATTPNERQKYMNIKTELFSRSTKKDTIAKQILKATSSSKIEQSQSKQEFVKQTANLQPITQVISYKFKIPRQKVQSITSSITNSIVNNNNLMNTFSQQTKTEKEKVKDVLTSIPQKVDQPIQQIIPQIVKKTGLEKEKVAQTIKYVSKVAKADKELIKDVALKENIKETDVEKIVTNQFSLIAEPEKNIEQTITIPSTISLEDYEEVKKMWKEQYEKGEVPTTENITNRSQWVEQDIVLLTNALNKLLSPDEELRQQALDDVSYLLPIFMINNFKEEELVVYLKAKLEAAKTVKEQQEKEEQIKQKLESKSEEEFVEIERPKEEKKEKTMEMKKELEQELQQKSPQENNQAQENQEKNKG